MRSYLQTNEQIVRKISNHPMKHFKLLEEERKEEDKKGRRDREREGRKEGGRERR